MTTRTIVPIARKAQCTFLFCYLFRPDITHHAALLFCACLHKNAICFPRYYIPARYLYSHPVRYLYSCRSVYFVVRYKESWIRGRRWTFVTVWVICPIWNFKNSFRFCTELPVRPSPPDCLRDLSKPTRHYSRRDRTMARIIIYLTFLRSSLSVISRAWSRTIIFHDMLQIARRSTAKRQFRRHVSPRSKNGAVIRDEKKAVPSSCRHVIDVHLTRSSLVDLASRLAEGI